MNAKRWLLRTFGLIAIVLLAGSALQISNPVRASAVPAAAPNLASLLPSPPKTWPSTHLEVGLTDNPGGAAALRGNGAFKFRYLYLAGGANTGHGWSTWNTGAKYPDYFVDDSLAHGFTPVFIYYMLLQSNPTGGAENTTDLSHLDSPSVMASYWADVRLLFQHLGAYSQTMVVDIEPDLWGYIQQASSGDSGASVPAAVASSGDGDVAGLANNADGFAQAFIRLRNKYAPNVLLGYELSMWGTLTDPIAQNIPLNQIDALAARSTAFQQSLGASFDLVFTDPIDRDAGFYQVIYGNPNGWWDATDYQRFDQYVGDFVRGVGLRMVLWQIPLGDTKMPILNNTWDHFQDNHVEWWFDDPSGTHLSSTLNAGVIAMLFGGGADGTTSAYTDGGYFFGRANAYYGAGSLPLPGMDWTPTATVGSAAIPRGASESILATVSPNVTAMARVDVYLRGPGGGLVTQWTYDNLSFTAGSPQTFPVTWTSGPSNLAGGYSVQVGVSTPGGATQLAFTDHAATFTLQVPGTFHSVIPARILDTRNGTGLGGAFSNHVARTFQVTGAGGVPAGAIAVTGNLTVTGQSRNGYLFIGPVPTNNPTSSTLNFPVGDDRANAVTVALGDGVNAAAGSLSVTYVGSGPGTAQVIFDVTGFFTPDTSGATYHALNPARVLDTRTGIGLGGAFTNHVARTFALVGAGGVPPGASAVTGNLTVTGQSRNGYLFIGPVPTDNPTSSTLNFPLGDDRANGVTVALGDGVSAPAGSLSVTYVGSGPGTAQVIFDVTGFFTPDGSGSKYVALTPARILDTRDGTGGSSTPLSNHVARGFAVAGGVIPSSATAVTGNLTVTGQSRNGYLFIGPVPTDNPSSSTLNFPLGDDRANAVDVALGNGITSTLGTLAVTYVGSGPGTTHVIFDVSGYFTP